MNNDPKQKLLKRAEDLAFLCGKKGMVTHSGFLSPAELYTVRQWSLHQASVSIRFHGGIESAERQAAFFLPDWMDAEEDFSPDSFIFALQSTSFFGTPGHRDYLGAVLSLGIAREWIGDILISDHHAILFCFASVRQHIIENLTSVGRCSVRVTELPLSEVVLPEKKLQTIRFTVMSFRLDAVCAGMFHLSRTLASEAISAGLVSLNYSICTKPDASVQVNDIISLRGKGKGVVLENGSITRKGRLSISCGLYL